MKATEAPEKIYITNYDIPALPKDEQLSERWHEVRTQDTDIEYTSTDAFIEKATEWLKENADTYTWYNEFEGESGMIDEFIEDFRNYMKGIKYNHRRAELDKIPSNVGRAKEDKYILSFLDTLEVKEVQKEPKFKIGDVVRFKGNETLEGEEETHKIVGYDNELYIFDDGTTDLFCEQELYELVK